VSSNEAHLERLQLALHDMATPFACGGAVHLREPVTLRFRDGAIFSFEAGSGAGAAPASLEPLLRRCQPAPFGSGRETRYDRRVRDALQLRATDGAFTVQGLEGALEGILKKVRKALTPDDPNALVAELYGLNVYAAGGRFVPHKDTPRGDDMLGTLVLCLPVPFSGGALELTHRGVTKTFDWSPGRRSGRAADASPWAAFFGDVDHEVKEVWSGHRVTLTWVLRRSGRLPRALPEAPGDPLGEALSTALADRDFLSDGGTIGFWCEHQYSETPGFKRALPPLDARSVLKLKGGDQRIATVALAAGLAVTLRPYVVETDIEEMWRLERFPTADESTVFRYSRLTPDDIEDALPVESHVECFEPDSEVQWVGASSERKQRTGTAARHLGSPEYSTTGYFGNEGGDAEFYLHAALLVTVPSWTRRSAKGASAATGKPAVARPTRVRQSDASPKGEFMASELHAMGHSPADVKRMLKEGRLERAGFGWYRFVP